MRVTSNQHRFENPSETFHWGVPIKNDSLGNENITVAEIDPNSQEPFEFMFGSVEFKKEVSANATKVNRRSSDSQQKVKLVGLKENPFTFGATANQPALILEGLNGEGPIIMKTKPNTKIEAMEKTISTSHFSIMKFQPIENQELFIWIKPNDKTHALDIYINIGKLSTLQRPFFRFCS